MLPCVAPVYLLLPVIGIKIIFVLIWTLPDLLPAPHRDNGKLAFFRLILLLAREEDEKAKVQESWFTLI